MKLKFLIVGLFIAAVVLSIILSTANVQAGRVAPPSSPVGHRGYSLFLPMVNK